MASDYRAWAGDETYCRFESMLTIGRASSRDPRLGVQSGLGGGSAAVSAQLGEDQDRCGRKAHSQNGTGDEPADARRRNRPVAGDIKKAAKSELGGAERIGNSR